MKTFTIVGLLMAVALLAVGCSDKVLRLGQGDCAAVIKDSEVVSVGKDCSIQRMYR